MSKDPSKRACRALNRLLVACRDEAMALDLAVLRMQRPERRERLAEQLRRRTVFRDDLGAAIVALGGVPVQRPSYRAKLRSIFASFEETPLVWPHVGTAYRACARSVERTARAYARALALDLPEGVRYGLERQYEEIEYDRKELRWLYCGGSLTPMSGQALPMRGS